MDRSLQFTSLGICAQFEGASERALNESTTKAIEAISKVNDAFKRALQIDAPPSPYEAHVAAVINQTAKEVLANVTARLDAKGWAGRGGLHEEVVNRTVDALRKKMR